jgi:hypothetical protein
MLDGYYLADGVNYSIAKECDPNSHAYFPAHEPTKLSDTGCSLLIYSSFGALFSPLSSLTWAQRGISTESFRMGKLLGQFTMDKDSA